MHHNVQLKGRCSSHASHADDGVVITEIICLDIESIISLSEVLTPVLRIVYLIVNFKIIGYSYFKSVSIIITCNINFIFKDMSY